VLGREPVVTVLVEFIFPAAITIEIIDAATDEMDVNAHLPAGAITHVHYEKDGRACGVGVWESAKAFHTFAESTMQPAIAKVAVARGIDLSQAGEPEISITEVRRLVD
jgi:N-methylhydantoinase A/oxoprolinase/acetone carboxylase beta subunit